jgi:hypothetical protein
VGFVTLTQFYISDVAGVLYIILPGQPLHQPSHKYLQNPDIFNTKDTSVDIITE